MNAKQDRPMATPAADVTPAALSIDLHVGDHCWATLTSEQGRVTLSVSRKDGPWRITRGELGTTLAAARRLLGA